MDCLPDEVVAEIMARLPDSRGIGLTCGRFWAVFCSIPDVAYWISGLDPRWLLPKMVPEVWRGSIYEIIRSDNLAVFLAIRGDGNYFSAVVSSNAEEIYRYLCEENSNPDIKSYIETGVISACYGYISPARMRTVFKRMGREAKKYKGDTPVTAESVEMGIHTIDELFDSCDIATKLMVVLRMHPLPDLDWRPIILHGTLADVQTYIVWWKKVVSPVMIAVASKNRNSGVFSWLYTYSQLDLPAIVRADFVSTHDVPLSADSARFYLGNNGKVCTPAALLDPGALEVALEFDREMVREMINSGEYVYYSVEKEKICAKFGVEFRPTVKTCRYAVTWEEMMYHIRVVPECMYLGRVHRKLVHTLRNGEYRKCEKLCAELSRFPGGAEIVVAAKKEAGYLFTLG